MRNVKAKKKMDRGTYMLLMMVITVLVLLFVGMINNINLEAPFILLNMFIVGALTQVVLRLK